MNGIMRKKEENHHALAEPQHALRVYLDALLCEVAFPDTEESANTAQSAEAEAPAAATEQTIEPPLPVVAEPNPVAATETEAATPPQPTGAPEIVVPEIVVPEWAQADFQCLSFQVAGITLATPLEKLNGIVEVTEPLTELPGYAPWMMGLLSNRGRNVQVVDIAQIVMPEGREVDPGTALERLKYVILVDDGRFGLASEGLSEVLSLSAEQVRWRSTHSKRPWLSGTVIDQMCAILDVDRLCAQLLEGLEAVAEDE